MKRPAQVTVGGDVGAKVWKEDILPLLRSDLSGAEIGRRLGVTRMTVSRWRKLAGIKSNFK